MKEQKICIIGDGLAGLMAATILCKEKVKIDLYSNNKIIKNNLDNRITAISESNYQYIKNNINLGKKDFFWPSKVINLFFEDKGKIINFLNFKKNKQNLMYVFQNKDLKKKLEKIISRKNKIKIIKKNIEDINNKEGFITCNQKKTFYDLIILSLGRHSKLYTAIEKGRTIEKNYRELALTANIKHSAKIENASQFFLKEGPLAILPYQKQKFSTVWSVSNKFYNINKTNINKILSKKLRILLNTKSIKNITKIQSYPINLNLKTKYFEKNVLILGDGLHTVHPMAGQGFNLVLRDIKKLQVLMTRSLKLGLLIKESFILKDFYNLRKPENNLLGLGINLTNFFFKDIKYLSLLKSGFLKNLDKFSFIKKISQSVADKGILF